MPEWANKIWVRVLGTFATIVVTSACTALGIAVNFYYDTKREIAVLKEQMSEVVSRIDTRVSDTETRGQRHTSQIASIVKKQNELDKEIRVGNAMPADSPPAPK
jgi:hypothetical protein